MTDTRRATVFGLLLVLVGFCLGWSICRLRSTPAVGSVVYRLDSAAVQLARIQIDSLRGEVQRRELIVDSATRSSTTWKARADRYRQLAEDLARDTGSVGDLVARLDTVVVSGPDSVGRRYRDSLAVQYSLATDLWRVDLSFQDRTVAYLRRDSIVAVPIAVRPWYFLPAILVALLVGLLVKG